MKEQSQAVAEARLRATSGPELPRPNRCGALIDWLVLLIVHDALLCSTAVQPGFTVLVVCST